MCMIAYRPVRPGEPLAHIPATVISVARTRHPDGSGLMWREDGALRTATFAPSDDGKFRALLARVDAAELEYAAHWRMATSGPISAEGSHPYTYEDAEVGTVGVVHNGVLRIKHDGSPTTGESDTSAFVRLVLAQLPSRWWSNPALVYLVSESIGWSKLTVMTATETIIINESSGTWDAGIWYSSSHKAIDYTARSTWTPAKQTAASNPKPTTSPPAARTSRQAKRAAKNAARRQARDRRLFGSKRASLPTVSDGRLLTHAGHIVEMLGAFPSHGDGEADVRCTSCRTTGQVWKVYLADDDRPDYFYDLPHIDSLPTRVGDLPWD